MKILWTDGSALPNPGPGGYAVIEVAGGKGRPVVLGREARSTNIRMEGFAMIAAIRYAGEEGCEIHTDSEFWINVLTKWVEGWRKKEWHKATDAKYDKDGKFVGWKESSIKNLDIVKELYELYHKYPVKLIWVRGHVGAKFNEMADKWAKKAREGAKVAEI